MTTRHLAPPVLAPPLRVGWGYHEYAGIAYLTHEGRIQAWATVKTPPQAARIERLFQRLTTTHTPYYLNLVQISGCVGRPEVAGPNGDETFL